MPFAYPKCIKYQRITHYVLSTIRISDNMNGSAWSERTKSSGDNPHSFPKLCDRQLAESGHQDNRISVHDNLDSTSLTRESDGKGN